VDEAGAPIPIANFMWERVITPEEQAAAGSKPIKIDVGGAQPCAPDGRFVLNDMAPGDYRLKVRPGGAYFVGDSCYADIEREVGVRTNRVEEIEVVAVAAGRLRVAARDTHGRFLGARLEVRDEKGIEVVGGPILHLETEEGSYYSDQSSGDRLATQGFCQFVPPLAPGRYAATLTLAGYVTKTVDFEIRALEPYDLEVVLDPAR
jgi:hypothetical protein